MKSLDKIINNVNVENEEQKFEQNFNENEFSNNIDTIDDSFGKFNIKIFGVGGAGCNVVKHMASSKVWPDNVIHFALNTDVASLKKLKGQSNLFLLGKQKLRGAGSGGDPNIGRLSIEEDQQLLRNRLQDTDILFLIAGLGKGTGSGATPEIAKIAKELGILTIAIVNLPSIHAEGSSVYKNALSSLSELKQTCDSITTISNDKIIRNTATGEPISFVKAFAQANEEVKNIVSEIIDMINIPTEMNVDFADIRRFFSSNSLFMSNRILMDNNYSKDALHKSILQSMEQSFTEIKIKNANNVIVNFVICEDTPSSIIADARSIFKEISKNGELSVVAGVDYSGQNQIRISFLVSANEEANDNEVQENNYEEVSVNRSSVFEEKFDNIDVVLNSKINLEQYKNVSNTKIEKEKISIAEEDFNRHENSSEYINNVTKAVTSILKNSFRTSKTQPK